MNTTSRLSQATAFVLAAAVTLTVLFGVNGLATSEHAGHDGQWLVQKSTQSAPRA
jgi:negative regulator of sigma E activity